MLSDYHIDNGSVQSWYANYYEWLSSDAGNVSLNGGRYEMKLRPNYPVNETHLHHRLKVHVHEAVFLDVQTGD